MWCAWWGHYERIMDMNARGLTAAITYIKKKIYFLFRAHLFCSKKI